MRITRAAAAVVLVLGLAGCSGSDGGEPEQEPSPTGKSEDSQPKTRQSAVDDGVPAPDSLSDFECAPDDSGAWSASGRISNDEAKAEDYRVTIAVMPPDGGRGKARQITLASVPADDAKRFEADDLPVVDGDDPACTVQVARLS